MMDKTPLQQRKAFPRLAVFLLAGMPAGALVFLALVSRIYAFWFLSRWPRLFLFGAGAAVCGLLVGLLLRSAWTRLAEKPRKFNLLWPGASFAAGILAMALLGGGPPAMPILHVLDIFTPAAGAPGTGENHGGPVVFIELRDTAGNPVLPSEIQMEGDWQRKKEGWVAQSSQAARLHYTFYAPTTGKMQVLFGEQPGSGMVQVELNGQSQQIDLSSPVSGQRLVELPFRKASRWEKPIFAANLVWLGLVLPLFLFVAPFYAIGAARWSWPRLRAAAPQAAAPRAAAAWLAAGLVPQKLFIVVFIALCLLPLLDYRGDWKSLETFFIQGNSFWPVYATIRENVFGDRFIGGALVGKDGWLVLANDFSLNDYQNAVPLTGEELYQMQQRIDGATRYFKKQGITFLVVISPNKNSIYPEQVPQQIPVIGSQSRLDQLLNYMHSHGEAQILDLRPALLEARQVHPVYYRTDSHWNSYGAYTAYVEIMKALQKERPELPGLAPHALNEYRYDFDEDKLGDIGWRWAVGTPGEPLFSLAPVFDRQIRKVESSGKRVIYSTRYNDLAGNQPNAVIFHDSFMDWLGPFLTDHFHRTVFVRALDMDKAMDDNLVAGEKPDIVIYECTERWLKKLETFSIHTSGDE